MHLNPAIAGSANDPRVFLHYRNQWPDFGNAFITYQGSFDQYIKKIHGGLGISFLRDNIANGMLSQTDATLIYSYRIKVTRKYTVQAGLQATFRFFGVNTELLQDATLFPLESYQTTQPDIGIGFLGINRNSQVGLSIANLNNGLVRFNYNYVVKPLKITFFYSKSIKIYNPHKVKDNGFYLTPAIMIQKQAQSIMINYGAGIVKSNILAGIWLRTNLPFQLTTTIFSIGYAFDNVRIGYSYDYGMLSLKNMMPVTGAHEITMVATFPLDPKRNRYGPVRCPKFYMQ